MFEILNYYDTCEKLIISYNKTIGMYSIQLLSRLVRKVSTTWKRERERDLLFDFNFRVVRLKI